MWLGGKRIDSRARADKGRLISQLLDGLRREGPAYASRSRSSKPRREMSAEWERGGFWRDLVEGCSQLLVRGAPQTWLHNMQKKGADRECVPED